MIPLVSISKFISLVFTIFVTLKLRQSWKKNPKDESIYCFYRGFFFIQFVFVGFLIPPLGISPELVQIVYYVVSFFFFLSMAYLIKVFLLFTYFKKYRNTLFWLLISAALIEIFLGIIYYKPALVLTYYFGGFNFIGWTINLPPLMMIVFGVLGGLFALLFGVLFLIKAFTLESKSLKTRCLLMGIGMLISSVSASAFYLFGSLLPLTFWKDLVHGFSTLLGLIFLTAGIFYKIKIEPTPKESVPEE